MTERRVDDVMRNLIDSLRSEVGAIEREVGNLHAAVEELKKSVELLNHDIIGNGVPGLMQLRREIYGDESRGIAGIMTQLGQVREHQETFARQLSDTETQLESRIIRVVEQKIESTTRMVKWLIGIYISLQIFTSAPELLDQFTRVVP